jgi:hypothetical protein
MRQGKGSQIRKKTRKKKGMKARYGGGRQLARTREIAILRLITIPPYYNASAAVVNRSGLLISRPDYELTPKLTTNYTLPVHKLYIYYQV